MDKVKPIKIASFPDVHLGHRKTLAPDIIKGLYEVLKDLDEVSSWDMVVFPGDLFDRLLFLTDQNLRQILNFFATLIGLAKKYDFIIRILEGTPGHDHKQSELVTMVLEMLVSSGAVNNIDLKHVTTLSIEYIERFDINVLYVPDEWNIDVVDTYNEAVKLMMDRGLKKVDYCLLHGAFDYQIDQRLNPKAHNQDLWSELVEYYIFTGHVHLRSQYKNILNAGSFDRLAHGEEEAKGWVSLQVMKSGEHVIRFHENKLATKFTTIDVRDLTVEEAITKIEEITKDYPKRSHIRLHVTQRDAVNDGLKTIKLRFGYFYFTLKTDKEKKTEKTLKLVENKFQPITLDSENIVRIVKERLQEVPNIDNELVLQQLSKYI